METVLDALKAMKKASAREIAARMKTDLVDVLVELQQALEDDEVEFEHGYWSLSGTASAKTAKRKTPKPEAPKESTVKIGEPQMLDAIREHGPQTAEDLATLFGITSRKVTSTLAMATGKGRLIRVKRDGKYWYCLPGPDSAPDPVPNTDDASTADTAIATASDNAESAPEVVVEESAAVTDEQEVTESLEEISRSSSDETESVSDTPLADAQPAAPDVMELPSPRAVAKNLRRHKAQLARLQKAHSAVQAVRRYGLQVTPAPKEIVREIRRLTAIVEAGTKLSGAVSTAKKYLTRMNRYEN
ncbi:DUF1627 domain-containing protein [Salmonella enterica]|uniref:DUF1627 domain-containing protein n=1 Tax=Salmonella enterica TaxID=28901 RepID=UPI003D323E00